MSSGPFTLGGYGGSQSELEVLKCRSTLVILDNSAHTMAPGEIRRYNPFDLAQVLINHHTSRSMIKAEIGVPIRSVALIVYS